MKNHYSAHVSPTILGFLIVTAMFTACDGDPEPTAESDGIDAATDMADTPEEEPDRVEMNQETDDDPEGEVEATCWSCHGSEELAAPPPDLQGSQERSSSGVGSHRAHLQASEWHGEVKCQHCHPIPDAVDSAGHMDEQRPADVAFTGLAARGGEPSMEGGRCAVYCHGGTLKFETAVSPSWTSTAGTTCTSCHAMPPPAPHPDRSDCAVCHIDLMDEQGSIIQGWQHIDSILQAPHGAHLVHLGGAGGPDVACEQCHDGIFYHGPLRDGHTLEDTTVCDSCHPDGVDRQQWHDYSF